MIKPNSLRAKILENYDEHGFRRLSWAEFALKHNTTEKYCHRVAAKMSAEGLLPETPEARAKRLQKSLAAKERARKGGQVGEASATSKTPRTGKPDALEGITHLSGAMPREQRLRILSRIAEHGVDIARIQAITRLEEFERAAGTNYGPPPPTTKEDTIRLLVELLRQIPPDWLKEALEVLNNERQTTQEAQQTAVEGPTDTSNSDLGGRGA